MKTTEHHGAELKTNSLRHTEPIKIVAQDISQSTVVFPCCSFSLLSVTQRAHRCSNQRRTTRRHIQVSPLTWSLVTAGLDEAGV